jgi:hypothetical protein
VDLRGIPTALCPSCGCDLINVTVRFDPDTYEICLYLLDNASCGSCGSLLTAPTPVDLRIEF